MTAAYPRRRRARPGLAADRAVAAGLVVVAAGAGAFAAASAFYVHPLVAPALLGLAALTVATLARIEVGIVAALLLVPAGYVLDPPGPPWMPSAGWVGVLFAIALARWLGGERQAGARTPLLTLALVGVLVPTVAAAALADPLAPALPPARTIVTGLALHFVIATQVATRRQLVWVLGGVSAAVIAIGGYAAWLYLVGGASDGAFVTTTGETATRVSANFGQPNQLGGLLVVLLPFALAGALLAPRALPLHLAALALGTFGVYVSFSRGAFLALAAVPVVFARGRGMLAAVAVVVVVAFAATPSLVAERFATLTQGGSDIATRADFWRVGLAIFAEHPVAGVGPGGFPDAYAEARVPGKGFLPTTIFEPPPHAHNLAIHVLAEQGVIGVLAFAFAFAYAIRVALVLRRHGDRWRALVASAVLASLAALLIHNAVDVTLLESTAVFVWALLGMLVAAGRARPD